jgi:crotonobetainyl-CoA:carnitine CoA-transferase CaiB-like acyl-CoA transferase
VVRPAALFADAQVLAEGLVTEHQHALWGPVRQSGVLAKFSRPPGAAIRAAPVLGQHSRELLLEAGFDEARVEQLLRDGVIAQATPPT